MEKAEVAVAGLASLLEEDLSAAKIKPGISATTPESHLIHAWISDQCRREAIASASLQGFAVSMEALVMRLDDAQAGGLDRGLIIATDLYRAARFGMETSAPQCLTANGLLTLERRATLLGRGYGATATPDPAPPNDPTLGKEPQAAAFLSTLPDINSEPGLIAAGRVLHKLAKRPDLGLSNARLARQLTPILLHHFGKLPQPLLPISNAMHRHPAAYRAAWEGTERHWLTYFLATLARAATDGRHRRTTFKLLQHEFMQRCRIQRTNSSLPAAIDLLLRQPALSTYGLQRSLGLSYRGAQTVIARLLQSGLVVEASGRRRDRVYIVPRLL